MMKKALALIMALAMMFSLCACTASLDEETLAQLDDIESRLDAIEAQLGGAEAPAEEAEETAEETTEEAVEKITVDFTWNGNKEVWSILPTTGAEGLVWINDAMGAVMQGQGWTYVKKDAQGDPSAQVTFVEDAIAAGNVGALMIAAMSVDMLQDVVIQALEAGIAVAMLGAEPVNYGISGCVYTAYEITAMFAVEAAQDWLEKRLAEGGNIPANADGKYEVACDVFTDIQDGVYRSNAMIGTVDASDNLVRVSTTSSYGSSAFSDAYNNAQDALGAHPDCRIFIAYEPEEAMGAASAIADFCEQNSLDLADFCVIPCYAEDTTFTDMYAAAQADPSANAIKGYATYGDAAVPYGEVAQELLGPSYDAAAEFAMTLSDAVIIPPVQTGEHLADILLSACGTEGYDFEYGTTFYDTITATNVYDFSATWAMGEENPAIEYKIPQYIG